MGQIDHLLSVANNRLEVSALPSDTSWITWYDDRVKTRLTITLSESTLRKVDQHIDGQKLRNRSHAIEYILEQYLQPQVPAAIILAGGDKNAEQFRPLIDLDGKPLLLHTLAHLQDHGVRQVVIATDHPDEISQVLAQSKFQQLMKIDLSIEASAVGTAGAVRQAAQYLPTNQPFFVWHGDVLTTINLEEMAHFHATNGAIATMAVKPRLTQASYHNVFIQGHTVVDFQKSLPDQQVSLANAGVYLFDYKVLDYIPNKTPVMLEHDVFPQLTKSNKLLAFTFQGIWFDITSEESYAQAVSRLPKINQA